jgi:hypothetical protein
LRWTPSGYLLYIRGICVLHVVSEGDAVAVAFTAPDKRRIHVGEANFPRWGVELHEAVIQLAQDPRLLTDELANAERAIEQQATAAGCRVVGRWLPWNTDGSNPVDWVGVDANGRPVLGVVRASATLADVPGWIAALHVLEEERERWVPDAQGPPRLLISSERDDSKLRSVLADSGLDAELCSPAPAAEDTGEPERRGRRRPRRRRRERGDGAGWQRPAASEAEERPSEERPSEERAVAVTSGSEAAFAEEAPESADSGPREPEYEPSVEVPDDEESPLESEEEAFVEPEEPLREEGRWERPRALETSETAAPVEESAAEEVSSSYPLEMEIEATLAEEREEAEAEPGEPIETTPVRRRNPRAAIVVRNTPDSILAALILARDRRNLLFFWVCSQEGLMDFFKGRATDLPENVDLLLVGFTAQPIPQEVISTVTLFRGRTQWFDHHEWPIEDLERLRDALGREAILFEPGAASPLAAVVPVTERRSRFTDKLVDLAGRRLSENDMAKWGYRVADLLDRLVAKEGDHRAEIVPVLSGKPSELPGGESVYEAEHAWIDEHDARIVHFGEYQMVVVRVPPDLDAGEVARRGRLRTGARLSLASREGDDLVLLGCNDEKRHINMSDIIECLSSRLPWAHAVSGGDRTGRLRIENLSDNPERIETIIGEIVKNRSILYG